jgi:hypothetical protein
MGKNREIHCWPVLLPYKGHEVRDLQIVDLFLTIRHFTFRHPTRPKPNLFFMNKFVAAIVLLLIAFSAMSQDSIQSNLEKAYKDPNRKKNSAKADVFIQGKRIHDTNINSSSATQQPVRNETLAKKKRKKKE